jgi:hypothetical protein
MSMISQILIFFSYFALYRNKKGFDDLIYNSEIINTESLDEDIANKLNEIKLRYGNQRVRQAVIIQGKEHTISLTSRHRYSI